MLGKHYLCAVVTQEESNGQAALASSNTLGSRQGLSVDWRTPQAQEAGAKVETLFTKDGAPAMPGQRAYRKTPSGKLVLQSQTINQQVEMVQNWMTPRACEAQNPPMGVDKRHHGLTHQVTKQWATPATQDTQGQRGAAANARKGNPLDTLPNQMAVYGQADPASSNASGSRQELWPTASVPNGGQTTSGRADKDTKKQVRLEHAVKQWGSPAANDANKTPHCEVNSNQAGLAKSVGLELQRQWGTPTARDHKSGRGNEEREYKELTPMVERQQTGKLNSQWVTQLMGLPLGFVSPSCPASVIKNWPRFVTGWLQATIAPTSCDSSETALCRPSQSERSDFFLAS